VLAHTSGAAHSFVLVPLRTRDCDGVNYDLNVHINRRTRDTTMKVSKLHTLLAIKAISLVPDLNSNDRRVGAALIDHYNRHTGRCDPGIHRMTTLLGISRRTVIRSINALVSAGWLRKLRHGGWNNRNKYEPDWQRLLEVEAIWNAKMKSKALLQMPDASLAKRQNRHLLGDTGGTQTLSNNLHTETYSKSYPKEEARAASAPSTNSIRRQITPNPHNAFGTRSAVAARTEAERRWHNDLHARFASKPGTYAALVEAINSDLREGATSAELKERGGGIQHLLRHLKLGDVT
jgi:hypothetical protein